MKSSSLTNWIFAAVLLFTVGVATDYYFLHFLFNQKHAKEHESFKNSDISPEPVLSSDENFPGENVETTASAASAPTRDNFLVSLRQCAPEIAAQAIGTPEGLMTYLEKSIGVQTEEVGLENFHLTLADGTQRRIHVIVSDNSNSQNKKEIRFFKLDAEGVPERLPLRANTTLESLLAQGTTTRHEVRATLLLKDGSSVNVEKHDDKVFEFQFNNHGKVLSCRSSDCQCPGGA